MSVPWKQWEGEVVSGCFPLRHYLGGTDRSAVFLSQSGDAESRNAAIKLVVADAPDAEFVTQWERAAQLSHPHLLPVWRIGQCRMNQLAIDYVVTEYAEENLADVVGERPLTAGEACEMLQPVLEALLYIHGEGLVHGHLKPANILAAGDQLKLSVDGVSRVGDWGTAPGQPGPYDPPEFAERGASPVGDIWSLGVTLVQVLTQQMPVQADPKQEPVLPETLPVEFVALARACLQPDPRRRATPGGLLALLRRVGAEPEIPSPAPVVETPRKRRGAVLVAGVVIAVAVLIAGPRFLRRTASNTVVAEGPGVAAPQPKKDAPKPDLPLIAQEVSADKENTGEALPPEPKAVAAPARKPSPPAAAPDPAPVPPSAVPSERVAADPSRGVLREVLPDITPEARRTIRGTVTVKVRASVDASGHVTSARLESTGSRYLSNLTLEAARQWVFDPAASEWLLRFDLTGNGTVVQPSRVSR
jgi:serine/threonine-protein kinase